MHFTKPKMMLKEVSKLINSKEFKIYIDYGFIILYDIYHCELIITYKQTKYAVTLVNKAEQFYWHLVPYNKSFFETSIKNGLTIVLFAIKENEELYVKKGK